MQLLKCPRCGELYSSSYRTCPFCEEEEHPRRARAVQNSRRVTDRKKTHSPRGTVIVILVLVLGLLAWYVFGGKKPETPDESELAQTVLPGEETLTDDPLSGKDIFFDSTITAPEQDPAQSGQAPAQTAPALNKTSLALSAASATEQLQVTGTDETPKWSVKDAAIASVDQTGKVTALSGGTTVIYAELSSGKLECTLEVSGFYKLRSIYGALAKCKEDDTKYDLTAKVGEGVLLVVEGASDGVTWSSSKASVATVSENGMVKGISRGTATITAEVDGQKMQCIVRVG